MDFEVTAEQELFHATTCRFLENTMSLSRVRQLSESEWGVEPEWWVQGAELGWTSMFIQEECGGGSISGNGLLDVTLVAEELGRRVSPGPLAAVNAIAIALSEFGSDEMRKEYLPGIAAGALPGWAVAERGQHWNGAPPRCTATRRGSDFVLTGEKAYVEVPALAEYFLVSAASEEGTTIFVVPAAGPKVTVSKSNSIDLVRRFGSLHLDGVAVPERAVVGDIGGGDIVLRRQVLIAVSLQCAETVGVIARVFDFTLQWAFDRYSFGRPLASYQALKHRFADMKMTLEACQATATGAARALQEGRPDAAELVSVAKSYIGQAAPELIQECVQMHGGIGVTWEHDLHLYLRRATLNRYLYGSPRQHRETIAMSLGMSG